MKYIREKAQSTNDIQIMNPMILREWFHLLVLVIFSAMIVAGLYSRGIMLATVATISIYMIMTPTERNIEALFFLLAFENIFKLTISSSSIISYLQIIPLIKLVIEGHREIENRKSFVMLTILAGYLAVFSYTSTTGLIKFYIGLALLFFLFANGDYRRLDIVNVIFMYIFGILTASAWAFSRLPVFANYTSSLIVRLADGSTINRFSGLWENSNYYSIEISIALAGLIILYLKGKIKYELYILGAILFVLGSMSQSKTFVITFVVIVAMFLIYLTRKSLKNVFIIVIAGITIYAIFHNRINNFMTTYFTRMSDLVDESTSAAVATTGRSVIWSRYLSETFSNIKVLFIGNGMETSILNFSDPHNMFIELLFTLGIVGTSIYFLCLINLKPLKFDGKYISIFLVTFVLRAFAANIAYYNNTWFYYIIIFSIIDDRDKPSTCVPLKRKYLKT